MDYWLSVFGPASSQLSDAKKNKLGEEHRATFPHQLALWASEPAIREYVTYMRHDREEDVTMLEFEQILFAFREDLGHSNKGLQRGDLLHLFVKGVEKLLREEKQARQRRSWWQRWFGGR